MAKLGLQISKKKILLLGFLLVALLAIPATIYLVQEELKTRTQATANTTLSLTPSTQSAAVDEKVTFDILMSPGNNQVNFVKLVLKFDNSLISTIEDDFTVDPASNLSILQGPVISTDTFAVTLSIGSDPTKVIQSDTKIGSITFTVDEYASPPTKITFDPTTQIRSINGSNDDAYNENVFLITTSTPGSISIQGDVDQSSPTPSIEASEDISPTPSIEASENISPTPELNQESQSGNEIPACTSIGLDGASNGIAPYTVTFTASGSDIDGSIDSVTIDTGDGRIENMTSGGGITTGSVNITLTHTYEFPGEYSVSVYMTDDLGDVSDLTTCKTTVTITDEFGNSGSQTTTQTTTTSQASPSPLPPTGPTETFVGIGALGGVLLLIGTLLFFAL